MFIFINIRGNPEPAEPFDQVQLQVDPAEREQNPEPAEPDQQPENPRAGVQGVQPAQ